MREKNLGGFHKTPVNSVSIDLKVLVRSMAYPLRINISILMCLCGIVLIMFK